MAGEKEILYRLKVSVDTPEGVPTIWRELAISGDSNLAALSDAILAAFGWAGVHKHEFIAASGAWKATDPQYGPPEFDDSYRSEEEITLKEAAPSVGAALKYNYDLSDPWAHLVEVTSIETAVLEHHSTQLTGGARNGIPEDCGGASGYEEFLEAIQDATHPEHNSMATWYKNECPNGGSAYDPEFVDFDGINKKLAQLAT